MRKFTFPATLFLISAFIIFLPSCKDDSYLTAAPPVPDQSYTEEFDTLLNAYNRGWRFINHSEPIGLGKWINNGGIPPYSGVGVIFSNFTTGSSTATISNWAISPPVIMQNGDRIIFYTASLGLFADRLQVRMSANGESLDVGTAATEVGSFTTPLLDINPNYETVAPIGYPTDWTRFEAKIFGLNGPTKGRFAFRYFVEDGGPVGANSNGVAVDSVAYAGKQ